MKKIYLLLSTCFFLAQGGLLAQNPVIFYEIVNERTVSHPTLGTSTAFDVMMYADQTGTFHSRGQLYINYNTAKFGTSVNLSNNSDQSEGNMLSGTVNFLGQQIPFYNTISVVDNRENTLAITWLSNFLNITPSAASHNSVPTTPTLIYTVFLKVQNAALPSGIQLSTDNMIGQQFYLINVAGTPTEVPYGNGFLPVEWLDFQANKLGTDQVELSWATASEINSDRFVVEKSIGTGEFMAIGEVKSQGNSDDVQMYDFVDASPMGAVNYYRLRQVDIDGTESFSNIVNVHFDVNQMQVYPSPTVGGVNIQYLGTEAGPALMKVVSATGQLMMRETRMMDNSNTPIKLDFSTFAQGVYWIQISSPNGKIETHRIVKL